MPAAKDHTASYTPPISLLVCIAATATVVTFAAVVLGYRAAETALNRRDAALAARQPGP